MTVSEKAYTLYLACVVCELYTSTDVTTSTEVSQVAVKGSRRESVLCGPRAGVARRLSLCEWMRSQQEAGRAVAPTSSATEWPSLRAQKEPVRWSDLVRLFCSTFPHATEENRL